MLTQSLRAQRRGISAPMPSRSVTAAHSDGWGRIVLRFLLVLPVVLVLGACSSFGSWFGDKDPILPDEPADRLYNEGVYLLNEKKEFRGAAKKFEEVDRQHPIPNGRASRC